MAKVYKTRTGKDKVNVWCKEKTKGQYTNYAGSFKIGNKIYLVSPQPDGKTDSKGNAGYFVTIIGPYTENELQGTGSMR